MIDWFNHLYPYSNLHELNLDWVIATVKNGEKEIADFIGVNTIKYANPILWNITSQYEANTVVVDGQTGNAYISVKAVPSGVHINRTEYWTQIYNYANVVDTLRAQIAHNEGETTTATQPFVVGDLVFISGLLYRVIAPMIAGDSFVENSNIVKTTIEDELKANIQAIQSEASARQSADTQLQNNIDGEASARQSADTQLQSNIDAEASARQSADTQLQSNINVEASARESADTQLQTNIDNLTQTITPFNDFKTRLVDTVNGVEAGIIPNVSDSTTMNTNTTIINNLLNNGKIVYLPDNDYWFNDTINITKHCGIIGQSMRGTVIHSATNDNGILVDIDIEGKHSQIIDNVYYTFVLKNFAIFCGNYPNSTSAGIRFRNYTWEVTADFNHNTYREIKGDSYAAEFRNCECSNIYISGFYNGIESGYYLAYGLFRNMFIETCTNFGIYNKFSDSIYDNITITFCYSGLYEECEQNKFSNFGVKMCGFRLNYDNTHKLEDSIGITINQSKRDVFNNIEVQECYANGVVIENTSYNLQFDNFVIDANGFSEDSGTSDVGMQILNGCYNITGTVIATNKNAEKTQRIGLYVDNTCHDLHLNYSEHEQQVKVRQVGNARRTQGALTNSFIDHVIGLSDSTWATYSEGAFVKYDGHNITISMHGAYTAEKASGSTIFNFESVYRGEAPTSNNSYFSGWREVIIWNTTDMTPIKAHVLNCKSLVIDEAIPSGKQIALDVTLPVWLNFA